MSVKEYEKQQKEIFHMTLIESETISHNCNNFRQKVALEKFIQMISDQIVLIKSKAQLISDANYLDQDINIKCQKQQELHLLIKNQILENFSRKNLKKYAFFEDVINKQPNIQDNQSQERFEESQYNENLILEQMSLESKILNFQYFAKHNNQQNQKQYQYNLIRSEQKNINAIYQAFALNEDNSKLFVGNQSEVSIWDVDPFIPIPKTFGYKGHQQTVTCLLFMKFSQQLVQGNHDSSIIILKYQNNKLECIETFNQHGGSGSVNCLAANQDENLIVSGSNDLKIKIWQKAEGFTLFNNKWSCFHTINTSFAIFSISLNDQSVIIACGSKNIILLCQQKSKQFKTSERYVMEAGYRLTLHNNILICLLTIERQILRIYNYSNDYEEMNLIQMVKIEYSSEIENLFPCQFIKSKNFLMVKHGKYINFFYVSNGNYELKSTVKFNTSTVFGVLTNDREYLITWDSTSKQIQTRRLSKAK